jgi:hypothetical protein
VANFLLAWHNADENGAWDPYDLSNLDTSIYEDIPTRIPASHGERSCLTRFSVPLRLERLLRAQCALVRTSYKPMPQEILLNQQHASIYDDDLTGRVPTSHKA